MLTCANLVPVKLWNGGVQWRSRSYGHSKQNIFSTTNIINRRSEFHLLENILKHLLKKYSINDKDEFGSSALHYTVRTYTGEKIEVYPWTINIFRILIKNGINVNIQDKFGKTVLYYVVEYYMKHYKDSPYIVDIIELLIENKANLNLTDRRKKSIFELLFDSGSNKKPAHCDVRIFKTIFKYCGKIDNLSNNYTIIDKLIYSTHLNMVPLLKLFIDEYKIDCKYIDDKERTYIHKIVSILDRDNVRHSDEIIINCTHFIKILLKADVDINKIDCDGNSALHYASTGKIIKVLIDNGADYTLPFLNPLINLRYIQPKRFGSFSYKEFKPDKEIIDYLIGRGISVNKPDKDGRTPIFYKGYNEVKYLIEKNADIHHIDNYGNSPLLCQDIRCKLLLLEHGADLNVVNNLGETPFHYLVGSINKCKQFLAIAKQKNINIDIVDNKGNTPLHHKCNERKFVKLLVDNGCNINSQNMKGETPFMKAATKGLKVKDIKCYLSLGMSQLQSNVQPSAPQGRGMSQLQSNVLKKSLISRKETLLNQPSTLQKYGATLAKESYNFAPNAQRTVLERIIKYNHKWNIIEKLDGMDLLLINGAKMYDYYRQPIYNDIEKYQTDCVISEYIDFCKYFDEQSIHSKHFYRLGYGKDLSVFDWLHGKDHEKRLYKFKKERIQNKIKNRQELFNKKTLFVRSIMTIYLNRKMFEPQDIKLLPRDIRKHFDIKLFENGYDEEHGYIGDKFNHHHNYGTYIPNEKYRMQTYSGYAFSPTKRININTWFEYDLYSDRYYKEIFVPVPYNSSGLKIGYTYYD